MASVASPLQLTALAGFLNNTGIRTLPTALTTAITSFNATTVIANWLTAVNYYSSQSYKTESTLEKLLSIGSTVCPALGNSIPYSPVGNYPYLRYEYLPSLSDPSTFQPYGFSNLIQDTGNAYLGRNDVGLDVGRFAQGFLAMYNFVQITNRFINTAVNADNYLGPTFTTMDSLTSGDVVKVNPVFDRFGTDVSRQGKLVDTKNLELYGTPAGLIQQTSKVAKLSGALPVMQSALIAAGLSPSEILDLVNDNRVSVFKPNGLTSNQFDTLQKKAYDGLTLITGDSLQQLLDILEITTPGIDSADQLLDPLTMFPLSYDTLLTQSPNGPIYIYSSQGYVNSGTAEIVNLYLPSASGCDELGKIIPQATAVANKALQVSLQNVPNLSNSTWPAFGKAIFAAGRDPEWNSAQDYLPNEIVADNSGVIPQAYQSQQDVPAGTALNNTAYWQPIDRGNLLTMDDLSLIQAQTAPVDSSVTQFFDNSVATGTGDYNTLTMCDVLGIMIDYDNFAAQLNTATTAINALQTAGSLAVLNAAYTSVLAAVNDAGVLVSIANANTAIATLASNAQVAILNTAWNDMANIMNKQAQWQSQAGVNYFVLQSGTTTSTYSLVESLPQFANDPSTCGAWDLLSQVFDTATLPGQAGVGSIREAYNETRLDSVGVRNTANEIPTGSVPGGNFVSPRPNPDLFDTYPKDRAEVTASPARYVVSGL